MAKNEKRGNDGWSDPLPKPVQVEGFVRMAEGLEVEGVILQVGESEYGKYLAIKVAKPVPIADKENGEAMSKAGAVVGVSVIAALKPVLDVVRSGPTAIKFLCNGKDGRSWDLEVRTRPAF